MKLLKLQIENFRNYRQHQHIFELQKPITILVGPNGKGKTNLLEAIYILSLGKSFRSLQNEDLIMWENDYLRCRAEVKTKDFDLELEVFYSQRPTRQKNFKRNGVNLKNSEYLGNLITVLFHPEDLNMLYLSPSLRRRYLDTVLCQCDKKYLNALSNYKKVLKQRNALLLCIRDAQFKRMDTSLLEADLEAWNQELVQFGSQVIKKRKEFVDFLNKNLEETYQKISDSVDKISLEYESKIKGDYHDELFNRKIRDIRQGETSAGPHRDDLLFYLNGKSISSSASRGEFRTILLAVKLSEISFIKEKTSHFPLLLLDDVFSELDQERQNQLLKAIEGCQTIITTTDINNLKNLLKTSPNIEIVKA